MVGGLDMKPFGYREYNPILGEPNTVKMNYPSMSTGSSTSEQGKSEGFDSCDRPSNLTQIGF